LDEFLKTAFGLFIAALLAWIFLPRTFYFENKVILYSMETSSCNEDNVCDVKKFFPPLTLRVDDQKSEIVWLDSTDGKVGTWNGCTIADRENWSCSNPPMQMANGLLQSNSSNIKFPPGYMYRIYWLLSLLPDLRKGAH
jgi:hypothetical protein